MLRQGDLALDADCSSWSGSQGHEDDEYMDYKIPGGPPYINNVWYVHMAHISHKPSKLIIHTFSRSIHMDPEQSLEPLRFDSGRSAGDSTTLYQSAHGEPLKRDNFNFDAGRRLCQGVHVAERSLFLGISRILWRSIWTNHSIGVVTRSRQILTTLPAVSQSIQPHMKSTSCQGVLSTPSFPDSGQCMKVPDGMEFGVWKLHSN